MGEILISDLICGDENERLCVRLSRLWDFCDAKDESNFFHKDLLLLDAKVRQFSK
jgi:replication factor A1